MLSLKDKLNYLMTFCCFMFVSTHGSNKGFHASCEVEITVRRGETLKTVPQRNVTVSCPVKHCGKSPKITWCKLLNSISCDWINETENVEITESRDREELISYLSFKQISIHDDGLYRCRIMGYSESHAINLSVSDVHQGAENSHYNAVNAGMQKKERENETAWLPYFTICVGIVLLILLLTALTSLSFYDWKAFFAGVLTFNFVKGEEIPTHMIPDLPKWSPPSTPVLSTHLSVLNDIHSSCSAERSKSPGSHPCENQPSASKPEVKNKDCAVYAVINHRQSSKPAGKQHTVTHQAKNPVYAVVNVS